MLPNKTAEVNLQKSNDVFVGPVPDPLLPGHMITITGKVPQGCTRYSINFTTGTDVNLDYALHFNPRLELNYIVRNDTLRGKWGKEETTSKYRIDIYNQNHFKYSFFIGNAQFHIMMEDRHFCSYKFRMPLTKIKAVIVRGDVEVTSYLTTEEPIYPPERTRLNLLVVPIGEPENYDKKMPNPYIARFKDNFVDPWQLDIKGRIKLLPITFSVNLQDGPQIWPHPNIQLHFNPRFHDGSHHVAVNSWIHGGWGQEERMDDCKLSPGCLFQITIKHGGDEFSIYTNGVLTEIFRIRSPHVVINSIAIQGDVHIYNVWVSKVETAVYTAAGKSKLHKNKENKSKKS